MIETTRQVLARDEHAEEGVRSMRVRELIELLRSFDTDAEVVITTRPNYPMEHAIAGVAVRARLRDEPGGEREPLGAAPSDVILVEGQWLRYGDLAAWDAARR